MSKCVNWKTGVSTSFFREISPAIIEDYAKNNIEVMEISLSADKYNSLDWKALEEHAQKCGVEIRSVHLPFSYKINIAHPDKEFRNVTMQKHLDIIEKAGDIGIKIAVIHPSSEPINDNDRNELMKASTENLYDLCEKAAKYGVTIAVENLPRTCLGNCSNEMEILLNSHEKLMMCFDTNHLLIESHAYFLKSSILKRIITLHVSDYDFIDERHKMPGLGKINWYELIDVLENGSYDGPFMYEVGMNSAFTLKDFKTNHMNIANRTLLQQA